jgi:hypothetical protein
MTDQSPTLSEWKALYECTALFKELAPWEWMGDSQVFGVKNPENDEIGYCCVLGAAGEIYGLLVYRGTEGLVFFEGLQSGIISSKTEDVHVMQNCLALTFDDREMLRKDDLAVIKDLGLKFRGRQVWPLFRSHLPGFAPYYLSGPEARYLTVALRYSMEIAERARQNSQLVMPSMNSTYLVGSLKDGRNGDTWKEEWVKPGPFVPEPLSADLDTGRLSRIARQVTKSAASWEIDFFFAPFVINEGERPYYPYVALYALHNEEYIIGFVMAKRDEFPEELMDNLMDTFEQIDTFPDTIIVRKDVAYDLLKPLANKLGVKLKKAKSLKAVEHAKFSLFEFLKRGN